MALRNPPSPRKLGRTVAVVGPQASIDTYNMPHARNSRGELGKALFNWYRNMPSRDPLGRIAMTLHANDNRNVLQDVVRRAAGKGSVNPTRTSVTDTRTMTRHIKRAASYLGADMVGIAPTEAAYVYAGAGYRDGDSIFTDTKGAGPDEVARRFPYAIVCLVAWDYEMGKAHRHRIGDATYYFSGKRKDILETTLADYIRELGFTALQGAANPMPLAISAGLGELGRNGIIISEKYGSRVHPSVILTDLPLDIDSPIDIGVEDFCKTCRKCAINCPTNSISFEEKAVVNGALKYKVNWETCYRLRPHVIDYWEQCLTCVTVCPYTKPNVWWRDLAIWALKTCPIPLRQLVVRPLKWVDDLVWGGVTKKRVRWLGYDTGVKPGERSCMVAGCTSHQGDHAAAGSGDASNGHTSNIPVADIGFYAPLKENTNRFAKRG